MSTQSAQVLVADDGELGDVRGMLAELGVATQNAPRIRSESATRGDSAAPSTLPKLSGSILITTPAHAVALQPAIERAQVLHVVVIDQIPKTLRRMLERSRCDFVLQRPIHPGVIRLLVKHALYAGPEKRRERRVVIGAPVKFKAGLLAKNATLIELSEGGCSLESRHVISSDSVQLTLPRKLTGGSALTVDCRVASRATAPGQKGVHRTSLAFRSAAQLKRQLRSILHTHSRGASALQAGAEAGGSLQLDHASSREAAAQDAAQEESGERRRWPRKVYAERVLASNPGGARALIGRDLSVGGMRVGRDPDLSVGDELKLAIYGSAGQPPVIVQARVARGDDESWGIQFISVGAQAAARLEQIVEKLPAVPGSVPDKPGVVISEVLEDDAA